MVQSNYPPRPRRRTADDAGERRRQSAAVARARTSRQDKAKARQRQASDAVGMKLRYNVGPVPGQKGMTGYVFGGGLSKATGSKYWTSAAAKNSVRVDAASPEAAMRYLISRSQAKIAREGGKARQRFLASEKKKSGRNTAKNTKRRER